MGDTFRARSRRRTRGRLATTLAAAGALLLSSGLLVATTAPAALASSQTCDSLGYDKVDSSSGDRDFDWGHIEWSGDTLEYEIEPGYSVDFCLKSGSKSGTATYSGLTGDGSVQTGAYTHGGETKRQGISHIGYKVDKPADTSVRPKVKKVDRCGTENDSYEVVADDDKFSYTVDGDPSEGEVTITFTAKDGYTIAGGNTRTLTFTDEACPTEPTEVEPTVVFRDPTCASRSANARGLVDGALDATEDQLEKGSDTDDHGVTFEIVSGEIAAGESVTIKATAAPDFEFAGGETAKTFSYDFDPAPTDCDGRELLVPDVDFRDPTCEVTAGYVARVDGTVDAMEAETDTDDHHVTFEVTEGKVGPGEHIRIVATVADGYTFVDDGSPRKETFQHTFGDAPTDCGGGGPTTVTPGVDFTNPTCADLDGADVDTTAVTGVVYEVTGTPGLGETVSVLAKAQPGYVLAGGGKTKVFEHTFPSIEDLECVAGTESIRPAVTFSEASCEAPGGAGFTGIFTDVVDYGVEGDVAPGESVVVTATIKADAADRFSFPEGFDNTFEHTFAGFDESECVKGTQTSSPEPEGDRPPTVLGTQAAVPTAVAAGLAGPSSGGGSTGLVAQLLVGAGLLLLTAGAWTGLAGRRTRGVHEA